MKRTIWMDFEQPKPKDKRLPTRCECGGRLHYSFGPGDYISNYCDKCTPVVTVKLPLKRAD